jgi:hypothetical protein
LASPFCWYLSPSDQKKKKKKEGEKLKQVDR